MSEDLFGMAINVPHPKGHTERHPTGVAGEDGHIVFRFQSPRKGNVWTVRVKGETFEDCDCPDFIFQDRAGTGTRCKHLRSLADIGAIPKLSPRERTHRPLPVTGRVRVQVPQE